MKDYKYIDEHPEQYEAEHKSMEDAINYFKNKYHEQFQHYSDDEIKDMIYYAFHHALVMEGKETKPTECVGCLFHSIKSGVGGILYHECRANFAWYSPIYAFGKIKPTPDWCPFKEKEDAYE